MTHLKTPRFPPGTYITILANAYLQMRTIGHIVIFSLRRMANQGHEYSPVLAGELVILDRAIRCSTDNRS